MLDAIAPCLYASQPSSCSAQFPDSVFLSHLTPALLHSVWNLVFGFSQSLSLHLAPCFLTFNPNLPRENSVLVSPH